MRPGVWKIVRNGKAFGLVFSSPDTWSTDPFEAAYSPSYGIELPAPGLALSRTGSLSPLAIAVMPESAMPPDPVRWLAGVVLGRFPVPGFKA